ncbi:MAG: protease, partial [Candidatus Dadabacteria bacterium]
MLSKTFCGLLIGYCIVFTSFNVNAQGTLLLRQPSVSKQHIVFMYGDDLWVVGRDGGNASRLTSAMGTESSPRISPDGKWVAFSGQYDGNTDVYIVPIEGGEPKRLTWHPSVDIVQGWTPDGKKVIFISPRQSYPTTDAKFFTVATTGGTPEAMIIPFGVNGSLSDDGTLMAYQPFPQWDVEWRNYRGGQAQPIWIFNM